MPITEKQRELRRSHIGSSDMPVLMGESPWRTPYDVWLDKTDQLEERDNTTSPAMLVGNVVENSILSWGAAEIGCKIRRNQFRVLDGGIFAASHDALIVGRDEGMEAKAPGIIRGVAGEEWGDAGTDQVPGYVIIQTHHQMIVSDLSRVYVPALIGGRGLVMFVVDRNADLCREIVIEGTRFWNDFVLPRVPPPDSAPSIDVARRIKRTPNKTVRIPDSMITIWRELAAQETAAKKAKEDALANILAMMGDAEAAETDLGLFTYMETERKGYTVAPVTYRAAKFKKAKELV